MIDSTGVVYRPLPEQIYAHVREQILSGELAAGQRLKEREISEELQVSRVPVREALPLLEADGLIRVFPRRGAIVNELTVQDVEELFDVRESLEVLAARLAAAKGTTTSFAAVERVLADARDAIARGDDRALAAANLGFHAEIVRLADNHLLESIVQGILGRMEWLFRVTSDRDMAAQCEEHADLFAAIKSGRVELAGSLAFAHVAGGREPSVAKVRSRRTPKAT